MARLIIPAVDLQRIIINQAAVDASVDDAGTDNR